MHRKLPSAILLPFRFDATGLKKDLDSFETSAWTFHMNTRIYQGEWSGIPLRAKAGETHPIRQLTAFHEPGCTWEATALMERCPHVEKALETFQCPLYSVRFLKLAAGASVADHKDDDLCADEGEARLHIPITTNDRVEFIIGGEPVSMKAGECWYGNFSDTHRLVNNGESDRVHLVIDCKVNDWLREQLERAAFSD